MLQSSSTSQLSRNQLNSAGSRPRSAITRSHPISAVTNSTEDGDYEDDDDIEEVSRRIQIEDRHPPVSPRDKLSYMEDKKAWKDFARFNEDHPELELLIMRMHTAIFKDKPADIVKYLALEFFADHNMLKLREELGK